VTFGCDPRNRGCGGRYPLHVRTGRYGDAGTGSGFQASSERVGAVVWPARTGWFCFPSCPDSGRLVAFCSVVANDAR
jgi:hypothetical protein